MCKKHWKKSDIKIHTDSSGHFTATHKFQGMLIEDEIYDSRADCRRDAVKSLKELKKQKELEALEDEIHALLTR